MVALNDVLQKRADILVVAARHGARNVRVFGSCARGQAGHKSDVDLLVRLDDDRSLIDHVALIRELEELLGCRVDVVSEEAIDPRIRERVLAEVVSL